jgi:hypothetical protein
LPLKSTRGITGARTYCLGNSESGAEVAEFEAVNGRFATGSDLRDRCALSLLSQRHLRVIPLPWRPRGYCYASSRGELPYDEEKSREDSLRMTPKTRNSGGLIVARKSNPCERFVTPYSTTRSTYTSCVSFSVGLEGVCMTQRDAVWNGACGMSPFWKGKPRMGRSGLVKPSRRKSQFKLDQRKVMWYRLRGGSLMETHFLGRLMAKLT